MCGEGSVARGGSRGFTTVAVWRLGPAPATSDGDGGLAGCGAGKVHRGRRPRGAGRMRLKREVADAHAPTTTASSQVSSRDSFVAGKHQRMLFFTVFERSQASSFS